MRSAGSGFQADGATSRSPISRLEADQAAVMAVLKAETDAWVRRDFPTLARHWVQSPHARLMHSSASLGAEVFEGWDAIARRMERMMEQLPQTFDTEERVRWERVNIVVNGDAAWVTYDQVGSNAHDAFELAGVQHELKIFHRVEGVWKIACVVIMHRSVEYASYPLIEVNEAGQVLWLNQQARDRINNHPGLLIAAGKLRARHRTRDAALRDTFVWAWAQAHDHLVSNQTPR
jgi:hypothetical protein